ncbi:cation diffusion facilitator family transporter [Telmatospirillum sp. J64-1]|uniref:cation diffusion facilitator family transporter n=1 Tax=Telmatospirillum sp. J64-1 TaxID=2502183 RepID=UPI00115F4317|nr:cation diffusion facilitator family transporter [Telmatospirillum sp. J64-1]
MESSSPQLAQPPGRKDDERLMRLATYAAVGTALILVGVKFAAYIATGSVAMLSTLVDSALDAAASIVNLFAVRHALQPADREHRFGHGKAEPLAGLGQAAFITGSSILLLFEASSRLLDPQPIARGEWGIAVMVFSILATLALVRFQKHVVARTRSVAIDADSLHYTGDLLINGSVILSLLLAMYLGWTFLDPLFALGIAAFLLYNAFTIARTSLNLLMDREFPDEDRERIRRICTEHPGVISMHDLRTRSSGPQDFIQLHLEVDGEMSLRAAHDIAVAVETRILEAFPNAEVIIHQDPAGVREERPEFG